MYGFIYVTTNHVNGKKYLGQCRYAKKGHQTYLGSGKALISAIKKYGRENFSRTILVECETREELSKKEIELISEHKAVKSHEWYNIADGGYTTRGFSGRKHSEESNAKRSLSLKGRPRPDHVGQIVGDMRRGVPNPTFAAYIHQRTGDKHPASKPVTVNGVTYPTITIASQETGISLYKLRKLL